MLELLSQVFLQSPAVGLDWTNLVWERGGNISIAALLSLLVYILYQQNLKDKGDIRAMYEARILEKQTQIDQLQRRNEFLEQQLNVKK
jgi:hypothetical protein